MSNSAQSAAAAAKTDTNRAKPQTVLWWCNHFKQAHAMISGPSVDEMLRYGAAFGKVMQEHKELHQHFYTGHEHEQGSGRVVDGK